MQQGEGIRVSAAATPGGSITVNVGTADDVVEIAELGSEDANSFDVPGDKDTQLPVPAVAAGTILVVRVGKGLRMRRFLVTIVAPSP